MHVCAVADEAWVWPNESCSVCDIAFIHLGLYGHSYWQVRDPELWFIDFIMHN